MSFPQDITTERLILRPFAPSDAPAVCRLAGDYRIAATTLNIPHPYEETMAKGWISTHRRAYEQGMDLHYAITQRESGTLIGAIDLREFGSPHRRAEMGYWIGHPYWGQGYCTEAARALVAFGFTSLRLNRIFACHLSRNPASGRVMQKIGMQYEGCLRQHVEKSGVSEDVKIYGILRSEWPG